MALQLQRPAALVPVWALCVLMMSMTGAQARATARSACLNTVNGFTCVCEYKNKVANGACKDQLCDMVPVDITYIANKHTALETHLYIDQEECKRLCIDSTTCAAAMHYESPPNTKACYLYNATEYTNGTKLANWETFLKSCAKTFHTVVPEYTFKVMVEYRGVIDIIDCNIETRLREHIPTQKILCFYKLSDGTDTQMTFRVTNVEFFDINIDMLSVNVSLALNVDPPPPTNTLDACAARMSAPANIEAMFSLTGVTCPGRSKHNLSAVDPTLVNNGQSCGAGMTLMKVDNVDKCAVCDAGNQYNMTMMSCQLCPLGTFNTGNDTQRFEQCAACPAGYVTVGEMMGATSIDNCTLRDCPPGMYISGSDCLPCPVGTYQDTPRQTTCKACRANTNTPGEGKAEASECTDTVVPEYTFVVMVRYGGVINIQECDIETRLREHIPTQKILCFYKLSDGTDTQMTFRVTNVDFFRIGLDYLSANVSLALNVDPPPTNTADLDACAARMSIPANIEDMFSLTGVTCLGRSNVNFSADDPTLVNNGQSCGAGRTLMKVDNVDSCGDCSPGMYISGSDCLPCPVGTYQDTPRQTTCKACRANTNTPGEGKAEASECTELKTNTIAMVVGISGGVASFLLLLVIAGGLAFRRYRRRHSPQGKGSSEVFDSGNHNQQDIDSSKVPDSTNHNRRNSSHSDYEIPVSNPAKENHNQQGIGSPEVADHSDYEIPDSSPAEVRDIEASSQPENVYLEIYDRANNSTQGHFYESLNCSHPNVENGHHSL